MTRMEKYAQKRRVIELENTLYYMKYPLMWLVIKENQKLLKFWKGAKH